MSPAPAPDEAALAAGVLDWLALPRPWDSALGLAPAPPDPAQAPWTTYWATRRQIHLPPLAARQAFAAAAQAFADRGDAPGELLCTAAVIETFYVDEGPLAPMDDWVARLQARLPAPDAWPSPALAAQVMACGLAITLRDQRHPLLAHWAEAGMGLLRQLPSGAVRMKLATFLLQYRLWRGEMGHCHLILDALPGVETSVLLPTEALAWHQSVASVARFANQPARGRAALQAALALSAAHGLGQHDYTLHAHGAAIELAAGAPEAAAAHLAAMQPILAQQPLEDQTHYWHMHTGLHLLRGDTAGALAFARTALGNSLEIGGPYRTGVHRLSLGQALLAHGDAPAAADELAEALRIADANAAGLLAFSARLMLAEACHRGGQAAEAEALLRQALADGAPQAWHSLAGWWLPALVAPPLARALAAGIEPDYVAAWVRHTGLAGPDPLLAAWPWPLAVHGMGRFQLRQHGRPWAAPAGKQAQRPLDLLRALLAQAPAALPVATALQWLWPEGGGADERKAFDVALLRLRRLLGDDGLLQLEGGRLQLAEGAVWTDVGALARLQALPAPPADDAAALAQRIDQWLALSPGPLLPDVAAAWATTARERLRQRLALALGGQLDALRALDADAALHRLETAVDHDPASQPLVRRLMRWHADAGQPGEAARVYRQLLMNLALHSGEAPAPETRALAAALGLATD